MASKSRSREALWLLQAGTPARSWGGYEILMLVALLIAVLCTWGFIELADRVISGSTQKFDQWAVDWFRQKVLRHVPLNPETIDQSFVDISAMGGPTVLLLITAAVLGFLLWDRRYNALLLMIMATVGGVALTWLLKEAIGRNRPGGTHLVITQMSSFPSGHSMLSAVIYPTLGTLVARLVPRKRLKIYFMLVALGLSFLIGISRIYLRVHYPTDVLAGWAAGLAWAAFCWTIAKYLERRGALEGGENEPASWSAD